jgi:DNA invertase Pin-like site-specific DNA recombinase
MTIWGYARVSTADQDPELQLAALRDAGISAPHLVVDHASGARESRPGLDGLLAGLAGGDELVVWKLDRLGRSLSHLVRVLDQLGAGGVSFRSLTEPGMDTTTAPGRLLFGIMGSLAEFERSLIRERTMAGLAAAKAQGRTGGRRTSVSPAQAEMVHFLIAQGSSQRQAAAKTGLSHSVVNRLVRGQIASATMPEQPSLLTTPRRRNDEEAR